MTEKILTVLYWYLLIFIDIIDIDISGHLGVSFTGVHLQAYKVADQTLGCKAKQSNLNEANKTPIWHLLLRTAKHFQTTTVNSNLYPRKHIFY